MRRSIAIMAGLGIGLISAATAWADAERVESRVLVLGPRVVTGTAPTILRGSAIGPRTVAAEAGGQTQYLAGRRLWVVDPTTGEVESCVNLQTSTVGLREVVCTIADIGGYSRTFGPNFRP